MSKAENNKNGAAPAADQADQSELRGSPMMAHLLDALAEGNDIGHYGRLTFVMVARHFLAADDLVALLAGQPDMDEKAARMLIMQVQDRDYNPPQRQKILEWQGQQEFPICPTPDDPNSCNVYRDLQFPDGVYGHVEEFYEQRAEAEMKDA